jgi:hypothetical protein
MTLTARVSPALAATFLCLALAGCRDEGRASGSAAAPAAPTTASASLDPRSQHDLARALTEVETSRDRSEASSGYARVRSSWVGKRYRWTVRVVEPLCRSRDACNVLPFDRTGRDRDVIQGWMPRLVLDDGAFAAIQRACTGRPRCEIAVEGTLSRLVADTENPTSVEFSQIRVL